MMSNCPTCGARLSERLVAAIVNPMREESCPVEIARIRVKRRVRVLEESGKTAKAIRNLGDKIGESDE
jgi:hypothetical protein